MNPCIIDIQNKAELEQKIKGSNLVVVDFWAPWCGPCKRMDSTLKEAIEEVGPKILVCKVNIDDHSTLAADYRVASIPTFVLFSKGKEMDKKVGSMNKEDFVQWIQPHCSCDT